MKKKRKHRAGKVDIPWLFLAMAAYFWNHGLFGGAARLSLERGTITAPDLPEESTG
jgi:hypothetical protein